MQSQRLYFGNKYKWTGNNMWFVINVNRRASGPDIFFARVTGRWRVLSLLNQLLSLCQDCFEPGELQGREQRKETVKKMFWKKFCSTQLPRRRHSPSSCGAYTPWSLHTQSDTLSSRGFGRCRGNTLSTPFRRRNSEGLRCRAASCSDLTADGRARGQNVYAGPWTAWWRRWWRKRREDNTREEEERMWLRRALKKTTASNH